MEGDIQRTYTREVSKVRCRCRIASKASLQRGVFCNRLEPGAGSRPKLSRVPQACKGVGASKL